MNGDIVVDTENALREIEGKLEDVGVNICDIKGGGESWNAINRAVQAVQDAIHNAYKMEV